jgi:hypothetical protein
MAIKIPKKAKIEVWAMWKTKGKENNWGGWTGAGPTPFHEKKEIESNNPHINLINQRMLPTKVLAPSTRTSHKSKKNILRFLLNEVTRSPRGVCFHMLPSSRPLGPWGGGGIGVAPCRWGAYTSACTLTATCRGQTWSRDPPRSEESCLLLEINFCT